MSQDLLPESYSHTALCCEQTVLTRRQCLGALLAGGLALFPTSAVALGPDARFRLMRLELPGLPDPRASALRRLAWEIERRTSLVTLPDPLQIPIQHGDLFRHPFCVLSGDRAFALPSEPEIARLRRYLVFGGFLLIDSAEGRLGGGFDASVRKLLARLLPGDLPKQVPPDHVLWKSFYVLRDLPGRLLLSPELLAVERDRRLVVLYSQNDLLGAMARDGFGRWEHDVVPGGDEQREKSFRFGVNAVMYALCLDYKTEQAHIDFILRTRRPRP